LLLKSNSQGLPYGKGGGEKRTVGGEREEGPKRKKRH